MKKKRFSNPLDIEVTSPYLWRQFRKNQNFCFYGSKGTFPDLWASRSWNKKRFLQPPQHRSHWYGPVASIMEKSKFLFLRSQRHKSGLVSSTVMKKEKEIDFPNLLDIEVTGPDLWRHFLKNGNFCFYGPKGTGPDLWASRSWKKKKKRFPQSPRHQNHRSRPVASVSEKSKFLFLWA